MEQNAVLLGHSIKGTVSSCRTISVIANVNITKSPLASKVAVGGSMTLAISIRLAFCDTIFSEWFSTFS